MRSAETQAWFNRPAGRSAPRRPIRAKVAPYAGPWEGPRTSLASIMGMDFALAIMLEAATREVATAPIGATLSESAETARDSMSAGVWGGAASVSCTKKSAQPACSSASEHTCGSAATDKNRPEI